MYDAEFWKKMSEKIENPSLGLPQEVFEFVTTVTPMINVDLLIKNSDGHVLMAWRDDICGRGWHIPGGIIRYKESIEDRIRQVAVKELKTEVHIEPGPIMINSIITPGRIRGHFISLLYRCFLPTDFQINNVGLTDSDEGYLAWIKECPDNMVLGQSKVYKDIWSDCI